MLDGDPRYKTRYQGGGGIAKIYRGEGYSLPLYSDPRNPHRDGREY